MTVEPKNNTLFKAASTSVLYAIFYAIFSKIYYNLIEIKKIAVGTIVFFTVYYLILLYIKKKK